jgi:general L-amino acid transport system permease protein
MSGTVALPAKAPPVHIRLGAVAWVRANLLSSPLNITITAACLVFLAWTVPSLIEWALLKATWRGESREACNPDGACWVFIRARLGQFTYGLYPEAQRWRVDAAFWLLVASIAPFFVPRFPGRKWLAGASAILYPPICIWLLLGGIFGLPYVETRAWGGLMLTLFMAVFGGLIAFPLGVLLALGRQSKLPAIRTLSVIFIEFWRGVPIITVIFLVSVLLPIILPQGMEVDKLLRALIGLALVIAAYMAEVVRGGLQAIPVGQYEAAQALGLSYWRSTGLIVLPQALRIAIPGLVNEFIALLKNTTLVLIVSLFDLLGIVQAALADPKWVGLTMEGYVFAGLVFWLICFGMSRWSLRLERRIGAAERR